MPRCSASLHPTAKFRLDSSTVWLGATRWRGCTYTGGGRASPGILAGSSPSVGTDPVIIACTQCQTRFKVPDGKVTARGRKVRYAQAFEVCEYGRRPSEADLRRLFPFFD